MAARLSPRPHTTPIPSPAGDAQVEWFPWGWLRGAGFPLRRLLDSALPAGAITGMRDATEESVPSALFEREMPAARRRLVDTLMDAAALEAVSLSNPASGERIAALADQDLVRLNRRSRERLRLAWLYGQRLYAKNDTTGFYGPVAWVRLDASDPRAVSADHLPRRSRPGLPPLSSRRSFVEHWVVRALVDRLADDPSMTAHIPLALDPGYAVEAAGLRRPDAGTLPLAPAWIEALALLEAAGAEGLTPEDWVRAACATGLGEAEARRGLEALRRKGVVRSALRPAPGMACPLAWLMDRVAALARAPVESRQQWLQSLERVAAWRREHEAGDLETRMRALEGAAGELRRVGIDTARAGGGMYVGRFPFYEDSHRDRMLRLGAPFAGTATRLLEPLARLHHRQALAAAVLLDRRNRAVFAELGGRPDRSVDLIAFLQACAQRSDEQGIVGALRRRAASAWNAVIDDGRRGGETIILERRDLECVADGIGDARLPEGLRPPLGSDIISPDVMIEATDGLDADDWWLVVGEIHPAVATAAQAVAMPFCPDSGALAEKVAEWFGGPRLVLGPSSRYYQRSIVDWPDNRNLHEIVLPGEVARVPGARRIPAAHCRVRFDGAGCMEVVDVRTGLADDLLTVMASTLHRVLFGCADATSGGHVDARLVHDRLLIKRRRWRVSAEELADMPQRPAESARDYAGYLRWAGARGIPRCAYLKTPEEPKPILVDFHNPVAVQSLVHLVRGRCVTLEEMRPTPETLWFDDGRGERCTAELRLTLRCPT